MRKLLLSFSFITTCLMFNSCSSVTEYENLNDYPIYEGTDLGVVYTKAKTHFRLWSPAAQEVRLHLYQAGNGDNLIQTYSMKQAEQGTWTYELSGDYADQYYTFQVRQQGQWLEEKPDPYAVAVGVNGHRAMITDLDATDPEGWNDDTRPEQQAYNDIILYELHLRDLSIHGSSGIRAKGKYAGLTETGTQNPAGLSTGLDHIKELGVTHVHLLPTFDHRSIDETRLDTPQYNWGYDPLNYNVPEGSFSTDPYDGKTRIREFKEMVQALHKNGLRVILDVVYNHTGQTEDSNFNQLVPDYYYRQNAAGGFSDASACGNETASERIMMRKFMIASVKHWVEEYHIDGFRFDLMGIHDIATMNEISRELRAIDPTIFIYGEGWTAGNSPLPQAEQALKANTLQLDHVAAFSDDLRDGLKGSVFEHQDRGFVSQKPGLKESIKFGVVGATQHPQINYNAVNYSNEAWAPQPAQAINYVSCHDNHTLFDKLTISMPDASTDEIIKMHKLAQTIVLTSQGVPFLHAGMEMLRTKKGIENSYESPDDINAIDWNRKTQYKSLFNYYRDLINLRKQHPAFRMPETSLIQQHLAFIESSDDNLLAYLLKDHANGDSWKDILLVFNGSSLNKTIQIPQGNWQLVANGIEIKAAGLRSISSDILTIPAFTAFILYKN